MTTFYQHYRDGSHCLLAPSAAIVAKLPKVPEGFKRRDFTQLPVLRRLVASVAQVDYNVVRTHLSLCACGALVCVRVCAYRVCARVFVCVHTVRQGPSRHDRVG
jgi:hypothetical protein